ncbi:MAG: hypothetical protein ACJ79S_03055 [Gemmatimonadaceae bacterium]
MPHHKLSHPSRTGPAAGLGRALSVMFCLTLGREGGGALPGQAAFAAANGPAEPRPSVAAAAPVPAVSRFAMTPGARGALRELWETSVRANAEMVACIGGTRGDDGVVRIARVLPLIPSAADSANAGAGPSLSTCRPPRWFGTVHTHIITNGSGDPYVGFSTPDRDVMARWEQSWRAEGVFCLLYSDADAHCEAGARAAADVTYAPGVALLSATYSARRPQGQPRR